MNCALLPPLLLMAASVTQKTTPPVQKHTANAGGERRDMPSGVKAKATAATSIPPPKATIPCTTSRLPSVSALPSSVAKTPPKKAGMPASHEANATIAS